jgi:hypothetical protein
MQTIKDFFAHPLIQIALAVAFSIVVLAHYSKNVLAEPLGNLELALPPLIAMLFQTLDQFRKDAWFCRPIVGIPAILFTTALVIAVNA